MDLFNKSVVIGVSVTPEVGLEVAQIDFASRTVLKYGVRPLEYDINRREIADIDIFKEALQDLFIELQIPKNSEIVLNIPSVVFKINDYPAALDENQISNAIGEELVEHYIFQNTEPCVSATLLPNSSMQFNKVAYTVAQKPMLLEIALIIKELGCKILAIDTSVNSALNALIYKERVDIEANTAWVLLIVENFGCRILSMVGRNYVDAFEEKISIGEVLGDAENYSTVISAVTPILKNLPSKYLCVVSKTNVISAEVLASKLSYSAPIIHQEANNFSKEAFMTMAPGIDPALAQIVSLDIIGAGIYKDFQQYSSAHFNLFNRSLGEVYINEQPPEVTIAGRTIVLSHATLIKLFVVLLCIILIPTIIGFVYLSKIVSDQQSVLDDVEAQIKKNTQILKDNENISTDMFDEGYEISIGLGRNKNIYSYYSIVGTEIPKKLWLTHLKLSDKVTVEGQADNLESVYSFFRSIKDYNPDSDVKLQKLGLATGAKSDISSEGSEFDTDSILSSLNADFYEFKISDEPEISADNLKEKAQNAVSGLQDIEPIE